MVIKWNRSGTFFIISGTFLFRNIYDVPLGSLSSRVSINSSKLDFVSGAVDEFSFELYFGFKL